MTNQQNINLAFYGDDFTGSTDALEFLTRAGARTVLFLDDPTEEQMARFGALDAIGVAGMTRAMGPAEMQETLMKSFSALKRLQPRHIHYKVCSTFDSSPEIGNIGMAIQAGMEVFESSFTPVLVAAPHLGRYSAFGNLYARMGIGSEGGIYRLDRHPSMRSHPVTPATESDLRLHLGQQTKLSMGLIDLVDVEKPPAEINKKLEMEIADGKQIIFFDAMYGRQMKTIGEVLDGKADEYSPLFSVGSSGVEKALGDWWSASGLWEERNQWASLTESKPLLVLSGSVSPITEEQIRWAVGRGFAEIAVAPEALETEDVRSFVTVYRDQMLHYLQAGQSVILHTAKGPNDPRINQIRQFLNTIGWNDQRKRAFTAQRFGEVLGKSAREVLNIHPLQRLVIAGGDTSSFVARQLGIEAVEMIAPAYIGAPLCRAYATGSPVDGMEVNLKGGQVGDAAYFERLEKGNISQL